MGKLAVFCKFRVEGTHCWPDAPDQYAYLRAIHRHEFHVEAYADVDTEDRNVEIIDFKHVAAEAFDYVNVEDHQQYGMRFLGSKSCETMAINLADKLVEIGYSVRLVVVSEDGENGAVYYLNS